MLTVNPLIPELTLGNALLCSRYVAFFTLKCPCSSKANGQAKVTDQLLEAKVHGEILYVYRELF